MTDTVSRDAVLEAIETVKKMWGGHPVGPAALENAVREIRALPPAEEEGIPKSAAKEIIAAVEYAKTAEAMRENYYCRYREAALACEKIARDTLTKEASEP